MNPQNTLCAVVMSTYNGQEHLRLQIDSILKQDLPGVDLYVRDDGSKDGTLDILREYEAAGKLHLIAAPNAGVVASFLEVIAAVPAEIPYVALCDQDDDWHSDKLSRAIGILNTKDNSIPQLYCSEYTFCDGEMNPTGPSHLNQIGVTFNTMLFENMVSGNTCVMNRALVDLINKAGRPGVYCHDWWIALVATALGELTYDDFSSLEYRRTGSNASPTGSGGLKLLRYRLKTFFEKGELSKVTEQLEKLDREFGYQMTPEKRMVLTRALEGSRLAKLAFPGRLRQKPAEEAALRLLFLAGKL